MTNGLVVLIGGLVDGAMVLEVMRRGRWRMNIGFETIYPDGFVSAVSGNLKCPVSVFAKRPLSHWKAEPDGGFRTSASGASSPRPSIGDAGVKPCPWSPNRRQMS